MLRRMGWRTDVAADGKQAVQALEAQSYDLVLMDVQMPEIDGYEATRIIRDLQSRVLNHNVPIIATTAHAMAGDAEKCLSAGMSDYIAKPIDPANLSRIVEKWLRRKTHTAVGEADFKSVTECSALQKKPASGLLVFNREAFLGRMMGDKEFAQEVATEFTKELPALMVEIEEQVSDGALEPIWKSAHRIKGSAANVGGEVLKEVAFEIEQAGKAGDIAKVVRFLPELRTQAFLLNEALQQWTAQTVTC